MIPITKRQKEYLEKQNILKNKQDIRGSSTNHKRRNKKYFLMEKKEYLTALGIEEDDEQE